MSIFFCTFALMRKIAKYCIAFISVVSFLFATNGINLAIHYCATHQEREVFLFDNISNCTNNTHNHSGESNHCQHHSNVLDHEAVASFSCCSENQLFLKLLTDVSLLEILRQWSSSLTFFKEINTYSSLLWENSVFKCSTVFNKPPFPSGKYLLTQIAQFLL